MKGKDSKGMGPATGVAPSQAPAEVGGTRSSVFAAAKRRKRGGAVKMTFPDGEGAKARMDKPKRARGGNVKAPVGGDTAPFTHAKISKGKPSGLQTEENLTS